MIIVKKEQMQMIAPLFKDWEDTLILSCLQGQMGQAWADNIEKPSCAQIIGGDFCFLTGDYECPDAELLVENMPSSHSGTEILIIPQNKGWNQLIETIHAGKFEKIQRYAIKKETDCFDIELLQSYVNCLSSEYEIIRIDEKRYYESLEQEWSHDFCFLFQSAQDYLQRGLGFCALHQGKMVCGASSYSVYDKGIEIEIATDPAHRRKGLATACGAKLILECLKNNKYPSWDAANMFSVGLSEKLGYRFHQAYDTYRVLCN